jgi:hypothetical protein
MARGVAATAVINEVTNHFGFRAGGNEKVLKKNREKRATILKDNAFMYKVPSFTCDCMFLTYFRISRPL